MKILILLFATINLALASESSVYNFSWLDPDKEIYVLQNRKFRKDGKFYVSGGGGLTLNGAFINATSLQARAGFFFTEDWGIEGIYAKNSGSTNNTAEGVRVQGTVPFYRQIDNYAGAMLVWSPFYSKINIFNTIMYFDWTVSLGYGQITTLDNRAEFAITAGGRDQTLTSESHSAILWSTGLRFYLTPTWAIRLDFTASHFSANNFTQEEGAADSLTNSRNYNNYDLTAGINLTF